ncbi:MAG: HEAT repeat domain-containing protein [Gemmataceae bacterium]|nr:HEAT repeat domain-containing protein [Gemmataceae bacterium]
MADPFPCLSCGQPLATGASRCPACGNARTVAESQEDWWAQPALAPAPSLVSSEAVEEWWSVAPSPPPSPASAPPPPPAPQFVPPPTPRPATAAPRREPAPQPVEALPPRRLPSWVIGVGLAGLVGVAVIAAVAALPRGGEKPPPPPPPPIDPPPPPPREKLTWPKSEPLLSLLALPWESRHLLEGLPGTGKPPVLVKPFDPKPPPLSGPVVVKRMTDRTEDALLESARSLPEVSLYPAFTKKEGARVAIHAKAGRMPPSRLAKEPALAGLPLRLDAKPQPSTEAGRLLYQAQAGTVAQREELVKSLVLLDGKEASRALAQRALFDPHPRLREEAVRALAKRPAPEWLPFLLSALRHPWPPAVEHAAEALAALKRTDLVPAIQAELHRPGPSEPYIKPGKGPHVREMVRLVRTRACLVCHPPSVDAGDRPRAPCPSTEAADEPTGAFVRGDIIHLRPEFALDLGGRHEVAVRERPARPAEKGLSSHKQAVLFALRELTGQDLGPAPSDWTKAFFGRELVAKPWHTGFRAARAFALREGKAVVAEGGQLLVKEGDARPAPLMKDESGVSSLAFDPSGTRLLAACGKAKQLVAYKLSDKSARLVSGGPGRERFVSPSRVAADPAGGCWLLDGESAYFVSDAGTATRLVLPFERPRALALSPDGKTLAVATTEAWLFPVEGSGLLGKGRLLAKFPFAPADLALGDGFLCALDAAGSACEVVDAEGHRVRRARLPDPPVACALEGRSLVVLTRTALLRIDLEEKP